MRHRATRTDTGCSRRMRLSSACFARFWAFLDGVGSLMGRSPREINTTGAQADLRSTEGLSELVEDGAAIRVAVDLARWVIGEPVRSSCPLVGLVGGREVGVELGQEFGTGVEFPACCEGLHLVIEVLLERLGADLPHVVEDDVLLFLGRELLDDLSDEVFFGQLVEADFGGVAFSEHAWVDAIEHLRHVSPGGFLPFDGFDGERLPGTVSALGLDVELGHGLVRLGVSEAFVVFDVGEVGVLGILAESVRPDGLEEPAGVGRFFSGERFLRVDAGLGCVDPIVRGGPRLDLTVGELDGDSDGQAMESVGEAPAVLLGDLSGLDGCQGGVDPHDIGERLWFWE